MLRTSLLLIPVLLVACSGQEPQTPAPGAPKTDIQTITAGADAADIATAAKIELGKWLFFDPRLSGSGTMSCSSCHLPDRAWTDGNAVSKKDDGALNTRNSPTMYNVGALDRLYWDGRATSLEKNILAAWKAQIGGKPEAASAALAAIPQYQAQFRLAGIDGPSEQGIVAGLATFLRSLRSGNAPFDQWQAGKQDAVSADQKRGYELFMGKAGCVVCHTPPLFTNRGFHNVGIGMDQPNPDIGAAGEKAFHDPKMTGYFKTPTLREVAVTAPYFHDGSVASLEQAVRIMVGGGKDNPHKSPELVKRDLSDGEIAQLVAFLQTLTSEQQHTAPTLPK